MKINDTEHLDIIIIQCGLKYFREECCICPIRQIVYSIQKIIRKQVQKLVSINIACNRVSKGRGIYIRFVSFRFSFLFFSLSPLYPVYFLTSLFVFCIESIHTYSELLRYFLKIKINFQLTPEPDNNLKTFFNQFLFTYHCLDIVFPTSFPKIKINY